MQFFFLTQVTITTNEKNLSLQTKAQTEKGLHDCVRAGAKENIYRIDPNSKTLLFHTMEV